ncbi:MAG: hypothetical protein K2P94_09550 [Rhodospirillaceae bacterium]|nr:hypothetical protein [Rhodospirillaceae bacterium]
MFIRRRLACGLRLADFDHLIMTGNIMAAKFPKAGETYTFALQGLTPVELSIVA